MNHRVETGALPADQVVLALDIRGTRAKQFWIVLERGVGSSICIEDPGLDDGRYVYVEADAEALYPSARGQRAWAAAVADGSVELFGDTGHIQALPTWFRAAEWFASPAPSMVAV